jgi:hypothetical protein
MTTAYTTLLGLALPVQGELTGTWGTEVNNSITQLLDDAIAGTATASVTSGDWTLTDTGSGVPNQARCAILIATGTPGVSRNIIAPARSKGYFVVNQSDAAVVLKGASTTGISVPTNKSALVVWNGSDFVTAVSPSSNGTVTTVSVASANGFTGSVSNPTSTPAITLTTSISGVLKGNGTAISAATSGTDYSAGTSALATGILKSTTSTGALTIAVAGDFPTLNQSTTGNALTATTATNLAGGGAGQLPYQTASGTTAMLAAGTATYVLTSNGTSAPSWQPPSTSGGTVTSVAALTLGTTGTDVSSSVANSTTTPVITLNIPTASASNRGALSSSDWSTFNGKYSTGGALGTPSSGTLTNCTGYTYANLSGTVPTWNQNTTGTAANLTAATTLPSGMTLVAPLLGTPSSGTLSSCTVDGTNAVGYKNIPQTGSDKTTAYTLVTGDVGKYVGVGTGGSIVVPTSTFANGDAISVYNNTTGSITITTSAPTAYIGGSNTVKTSITLATRGIATILFVSATVCVVSGNVS